MLPEILTRSGMYFNFVEPEKSVIDLHDIARALTRLCRFTGHTKDFYSVATHSVWVSYLVPPEHRLQALLHDASEAYLGDVSSPLKQLLPEYKAIEKRVEAAIATHFGLPAELSPEVKHADLVMLMTEKRDLMPSTTRVWDADGVQPMESHVYGMNPDDAYSFFIGRYEFLTNERKISL